MDYKPIFAGRKLSLEDQKNEQVKSQLSTLFAGRKTIFVGRKQRFRKDKFRFLFREKDSYFEILLFQF
jgi:hypothetical protein